MAAAMQTGEDAHGGVVDAEIDQVGEAIEHGAMHVEVEEAVDAGSRAELLEESVDCLTKLATEARLLGLVPGLGFGELLLGSSPDTNCEPQASRSSRARTSSHGLSSSG